MKKKQKHRTKEALAHYDRLKRNRLRKEVLTHYERLMECKTREEFLHEGWKSDSCVLCRHYKNCRNCPVAVHTKINDCYATPWRKMNGSIHRFVEECGPLPSQEVIAMYEFLKTVDFGVKE